MTVETFDVSNASEEQQANGERFVGAQAIDVQAIDTQNADTDSRSGSSVTHRLVIPEEELGRWRSKARLPRSDINGSGGYWGAGARFWNTLPRTNQVLMVLATLMFYQGFNRVLIAPWWEGMQEAATERRRIREAEEEAESIRRHAEEREAEERDAALQAAREQAAQEQAAQEQAAQEEAAQEELTQDQPATGEQLHDSSEPLDYQSSSDSTDGTAPSDGTTNPYATNGEENIGVGENENE